MQLCMYVDVNKKMYWQLTYSFASLLYLQPTWLVFEVEILPLKDYDTGTAKEQCTLCISRLCDFMRISVVLGFKLFEYTLLSMLCFKIANTDSLWNRDLFSQLYRGPARELHHPHHHDMQYNIHGTILKTF